MAEQKKIVNIPGVGDYEVTAEAEGAPRTIWGRVVDAVTNPEIVSGAASLIPGVGTGAAATIGAGASVVNDYRHGDTDSMGMAGRALLHGGLSAIPGVGGAIAKRGLPAASEAATAMAGDSGILGTAMKGIKALFEGGKIPGATPTIEAAAAGGVKRASTATQMALLQQKLVDPSLNTTAKAAVLTAIKKLQEGQGTSLANKIRLVLGGGSVAADQAGGQ